MSSNDKQKKSIKREEKNLLILRICLTDSSQTTQHILDRCLVMTDGKNSITEEKSITRDVKFVFFRFYSNFI